MVVEFSRRFLKDLKRLASKQEARKIVRRLAKTTPSDGDFVALVSHIVIREKRHGSFRFYLIISDEKKHIITRDELKEFLIKFVALSKKDNQQQVIDKLRDDIRRCGFGKI